MINYESDEERAEAIKKWWKENGLSILLGVGIGLGAIFGWRAWMGYRETVGQQASAAFEQLLAAAAGNAQSTRAQSKLLREEFAATAYATLASLVQARVEVEAGNLAAARTALEQAIAGSPAPGIRRIAALRLARVLIAEGDLEGAAGLVAQHDDSKGFGGAFAALRGEIAQAQGRMADARAAYEQALAAGAPSPDRIRMKLDNLPPAS
ncbi:YfgM family protein [Candidatus Thiosymbion oneisti]|uniref:YfgM family protein n=1 Tax=Candidatus Thiosymbion oneisti TaxID=589554 RepID=UPI001FB7A486|nr:tetratricopeptide repeat protein [Candidatus Thiosymbion oneisti]